MSVSSQNLLDTKLPEEIGLKELKIMQLKKKKVRVSTSTDVHNVENNPNQQSFKGESHQSGSTLLPVIENQHHLESTMLLELRKNEIMKKKQESLIKQQEL